MVDDLRIIGETEEHGTTVHFIPDPEIFQETTEFDFGKLAKRFQELAFLNKGLRISIIDKREGLEQEKHYHYEGGITSYVKYINENKDVIFDEPIYTYGEMDGISVEVAMQYTTGYHETVMSFANNIHTHEGGTHEQGFRTALTRVINDYARQNKILKEKDDNLTGDDVREGLTAIISVKHPNPQFEGQTKTKLGNSEVVKITNRLFSEALSRFLLENPAATIELIPLASPDEIYQLALGCKASIQAAQYRLEGSKHSIRIAQSGYYPQLTLSGSLGTNYYSTINRTFSQQMSDNFNKYIGFNLSVPIFNRLATRNRVRTARLQRENYSLQLDNAKKDLYKEIQQAWYNAAASESKYTSSSAAASASEASFKLMSEKYENGKANAVEYNEAKQNLMKAQSDELQAKYEYLFRTKILDFYKGEPIE